MKLILGAFLIDLSIGNLLFKKRNDQTFLSNKWAFVRFHC